MSYGSAWRAAARALAELGAAAFFIAGTARASIGASAPWFVLVAVGLGLVLRTADIEARSLSVPGGLYGGVRATLGKLPATAAVSAVLVDRLALGALAAALAGHYVAAVGRLADSDSTGWVADNAAVAIAVALLAIVWVFRRQGRPTARNTAARIVAVAVGVLAGLVVWAAATALFHGRWAAPFPLFVHRLLAGRGGLLPWLPSRFLPIAALAAALGYALPALGGIDAFAAASVDLQEPRNRNLRLVARLVAAYSLVATAAIAFLFVALVPDEAKYAWHLTPLVGVALNIASPEWLRPIVLVAVVAGAFAFLSTTVRATTIAAYGTLARLADEGVLGHDWRAPHHRFGTPWRIIDAVGTAQIAIVLLSAGQVDWLAGVYAVGVACSAVLKAAALVRYRKIRPEKRAYRVPVNMRMFGRDWPVLLIAVALVVAAATTGLVLMVDGPTLAALALILVLTGALVVSERASSRDSAEDLSRPDSFQVLPAPQVDPRHVNVHRGGLLVPVRKPRGLVHLTDALRIAGDRDVVAMTVRLIGVDVPDEATAYLAATDDERELFSAVVAAAEREGRAVRLMIVPAMNVYDAVIETALRLESSEIHVGESETLSADDQARLLGDAWERAPRQASYDVRVVVHHPRGGTDAYHLGAHAPALRPEDFEQIHRLWLDVVKSIGPHVHHRDVVRAALTHMEQQLNGPDRDGVLRVVRATVHPADEIAPIIRNRDFGRLRDVLRNRPASDLASVLAELSLDERVLVFRILPRKEAAATFAYLSPDEQNALLRAMASEEAAALLNNMPPDDRTTFLEELPAEATRQLLAMLTPEERAEAVRLLGYPENSIGRLMTPHYVAVREDWTVEQVLEYVRTHGHDSETLNVLYVVDDKGLLIDDIRIREFLLNPRSRPVSELMDRRFVALKAADDQETAVRVFRAEDRTALPVTDSAGALIGIVTVDDVLDVAEQEATEDLQRFGGSEALDEPYMRVRFARMVQKRAGWLTALFLGEMLTATAMGFFQREIERAVVLALFVPLIISSGGNSGSQASTLVIRALALGELTLGDWWRVMRREFAAGLALGGILGTIGFLRITVWSTFSTIYGPHWLLVAITVALALVGIVMWGTLVGSLLPFGLRRLGFDPASSSAPFVATLVDVTGLIIYFSVGLVVLRGTLL